MTYDIAELSHISHVALDVSHMPQWQRESTPLLWCGVFLKSATTLPLCDRMFGQLRSASMTFGMHVLDFEGNRSTWGKPTQMFFPYRHKDRELRPGPFHWPSFQVSVIFEKQRYNSKTLKKIWIEYNNESLNRILQSQRLVNIYEFIKLIMSIMCSYVKIMLLPLRSPPSPLQLDCTYYCVV